MRAHPSGSSPVAPTGETLGHNRDSDRRRTSRKDFWLTRARRTRDRVRDGLGPAGGARERFGRS